MGQRSTGGSGCSADNAEVIHLLKNWQNDEFLNYFNTRYLERKLGGRRISVGGGVVREKRSSLMDLLDVGLVIEEQVGMFFWSKILLIFIPGAR